MCPRCAAGVVSQFWKQQFDFCLLFAENSSEPVSMQVEEILIEEEEEEENATDDEHLEIEKKPDVGSLDFGRWKVDSDGDLHSPSSIDSDEEKLEELPKQAARSLSLETLDLDGLPHQTKDSTVEEDEKKEKMDESKVVESAEAEATEAPKRETEPAEEEEVPRPKQGEKDEQQESVNKDDKAAAAPSVPAKEEKKDLEASEDDEEWITRMAKELMVENPEASLASGEEQMEKILAKCLVNRPDCNKEVLKTLVMKLYIDEEVNGGQGHQVEPTAAEKAEDEEPKESTAAEKAEDEEPKESTAAEKDGEEPKVMEPTAAEKGGEEKKRGKESRDEQLMAALEMQSQREKEFEEERRLRLEGEKRWAAEKKEAEAAHQVLLKRLRAMKEQDDVRDAKAAEREKLLMDYLKKDNEKRKQHEAKMAKKQEEERKANEEAKKQKEQMEKPDKETADKMRARIEAAKERARRAVEQTMKEAKKQKVKAEGVEGSGDTEDEDMDAISDVEKNGKNAKPTFSDSKPLVAGVPKLMDGSDDECAGTLSEQKLLRQRLLQERKDTAAVKAEKAAKKGRGKGRGGGGAGKGRGKKKNEKKAVEDDELLQAQELDAADRSMKLEREMEDVKAERKTAGKKAKAPTSSSSDSESSFTKYTPVDPVTKKRPAEPLGLGPIPKEDLPRVKRLRKRRRRKQPRCEEAEAAVTRTDDPPPDEADTSTSEEEAAGFLTD